MFAYRIFYILGKILKKSNNKIRLKKQSGCRKKIPYICLLSFKSTENKTVLFGSRLHQSSISIP